MNTNDAISENNRKATTVHFKSLEEEIESRFANLLAAKEPELHSNEDGALGRDDSSGELTYGSKLVVTSQMQPPVIPGEKHIRYAYSSDGMLISEEQLLRAELLAPDRLRIVDSSPFFEDFRLLYGDECLVKALGDNNFELVSIIQQSPMRHFSFIGSGSPEHLIEGLHRVGGEWESDMGGWFVLHIPVPEFEAFNAEYGLRLRPEEEIFSDLQVAPR